MRQRYIQSFAASGDVQTALEEQALGKPYVAYLEDAEKIDWDTLTPTPPGPDYSQMPLTFEILSIETGTGLDRVCWNYNYPGTTGKTIEYSLNGGTWTSINSADEVEIPVQVGDIIQFRGANASYCEEVPVFEPQPHKAFENVANFSGTVPRFKAYGNIMSLIDPTNFSGLTSFPAGSVYNFKGLFDSVWGLVDATNLILPVETLSEGCYKNLFKYDTNLTGITCLATDISATDCTKDWVNYVSPTGTFVKHPDMYGWSVGVNGIPGDWTIEDADI